MVALTGTSYGEENKVTDSSKIEEVKSYIYKDIDRTLTLGNALATRDMCKSISWDFKVDSRKREVVEYTCELTGYQEYMEQFSSEGAKLEQLKTKYTEMLGAKQDAEMYVAFMEEMEKQKVFATFAEIKKKTPGINKMSLFVRGQTYDGAIEAGISEKLINKFMKASKIYNDALKDEELSALADDPINSSMLDEMTNKGSYNHKMFLSYMDGLNKIRSGKYANINTVKEEIDYIERQQAKAKKSKAAAPATRVVQTIGFTMIKDRPMVVNCNFSYYDNPSKAKPKAVERVDSYSVCLKESYQAEYDDFYTGVFNKLQVK